MTKKLRILTNAAFTTTNATLEMEDVDQNFIELQEDIDTLTAQLTSVHTQNTDRYLEYGEATVYDNHKNFHGSFNGDPGDSLTVIFKTDNRVPIFSSVDDYEIDIYGLITDEDNITQRVEVGYSAKTTNGFSVHPTIACKIVWKVLGNLRPNLGI